MKQYCSGMAEGAVVVLEASGDRLYAGGCSCPYKWEKIGTGQAKKSAEPKFILQYELDSDPFEFFMTEKDLRKRIEELAANPSLKRDSMKVYTIKSVRSVKLGVKISIS